MIKEFSNVWNTALGKQTFRFWHFPVGKYLWRSINCHSRSIIFPTNRFLFTKSYQVARRLKVGIETPLLPPFPLGCYGAACFPRPVLVSVWEGWVCVWLEREVEFNPSFSSSKRMFVVTLKNNSRIYIGCKSKNV